MRGSRKEMLIMHGALIALCLHMLPMCSGARRGTQSLSQPCELTLIHLQDVARRQHTTVASPSDCTTALTSLPVRAQRLNFTPTSDGICNGVVVWPELVFENESGGGQALVWDTRSASPGDSAVCDSTGSRLMEPVGESEIASQSHLWQPSVQQGLLHWKPRRVQAGRQVEVPRGS
jgi:hypothetical protein